MDVPVKNQYTMTRFHMNKDNMYGSFTNEFRYDLLEAVIICLGSYENIDKGNQLQKMLSTLLTDKLTYSEKKDILNNEFEIPTTVEMKGGFEKMCNLSDGIEARGLAKGLQASVRIVLKYEKKLDAIYASIVENEVYKDVTKEQVEEIYNSVVKTE